MKKITDSLKYVAMRQADDDITTAEMEDTTSGLPEDTTSSGLSEDTAVPSSSTTVFTSSDDSTREDDSASSTGRWRVFNQNIFIHALREMFYISIPFISVYLCLFLSISVYLGLSLSSPSISSYPCISTSIFVRDCLCLFKSISVYLGVFLSLYTSV